jgi:hypothetical protein
VAAYICPPDSASKRNSTLFLQHQYERRIPTFDADLMQPLVFWEIVRGEDSCRPIGLGFLTSSPFAWIDFYLLVLFSNPRFGFLKN